MRHLKYESLLLVLLVPIVTDGQIANHNYVMTSTYLDSQASAGITAVQFYDGLGRPSVSATDGMGVGGVYTYTETVYDQNGRVLEKWLPAVGSTSLSFPGDMAYLSYSTYGESFAYSENSYDALDRLVSSTGPGTNWHTNNKNTSYIFSFNTANSVKKYYVNTQTGTLSQNGFYPAGALSLEKTIDEDGRQVETYKDLLGSTILDRRQGPSGNNDTYYVYNQRHQLSYVLSPKYQESASLNDYAYRYTYNSKGLLESKKLPGCAPVMYWYDPSTNLLAFMQDGQLCSSDKYRFYLYDKDGRQVVQGICEEVPPATEINAQADYNSTMVGVCNTGYVMVSNSDLGDVSLEIACFYDRYLFGNSILDTGLRSQLLTSTTGRATGMLTGRIVTATNGERLYTVYYYDTKGNLLNERRSLLGGAVLTTEAAYTFTDKLSEVTQQLTKGGATHTLSFEYSYYAANDQIHDVSVSLNGNTPVQTALYEYDDLGRVSRVRRGEELFSTVYDYNVRGWLTENRNSKYQEWLDYHSDFNGNISMQIWRNGNNNDLFNYNFNYDGLNRMTSAEYTDELGTTQNVIHEQATYDRNGNISRLFRYGLREGNSFGLIDSLVCVYDGNRLVKVDDGVSGPSSTSSFHFRDYSNSDVEYEYDENGNMTKDLNRKISSIQYNLLNLPTKITFSGGSNASYVYNSGGEKMKSVYYTSHVLAEPLPDSLIVGPYPYPGPLSVGGVSFPMGGFTPFTPLDPLNPFIEGVYDSLEYCGNFLFKNSKIEQVLFDGGYITVDTTGVPYYHYYQRDHLGSIRAVVDEEGTLEHTNNYYPFGALYRADATTDIQRHKYNGKELDRMHGLNLFDYGARWYDPLLCRFTTMDPLCEKYYNVSPYAYCANNPVNAVDPDGRKVYFVSNSSNSFKKDFSKAVVFLNVHKASSLLYKLNDSENVYYIKETNGHNAFDYRNSTIEWNPRMGLYTSEDAYLSPTTLLNHEIDHALQYDTKPDVFLQDIKKLPEKSPDNLYYTKEEKRVITGAETETARALGEIPENGITRKDHSGFLYPVTDPTSNKLKSEADIFNIIIKP